MKWVRAHDAYNSTHMQFLIPAARIARLLAIALWVGAMAGFAFIFAPTAFHVIGPTPVFATTIAATLRALTAFGFGCAVVAALATLALPGRFGRKSIVFAFAIAAMCGLSFFEIASVVPQMERTPLRTGAYEKLHRQSSRVYTAVLLLGFLSLALLAEGRRRGEEVFYG
ncbi:MAG: hypothetical protein NVS9B12_15430 [Vulcanimicrobiaceae bacterium]